MLLLLQVVRVSERKLRRLRPHRRVPNQPLLQVRLLAQLQVVGVVAVLVLEGVERGLRTSADQLGRAVQLGAGRVERRIGDRAAADCARLAARVPVAQLALGPI